MSKQPTVALTGNLAQWLQRRFSHKRAILEIPLRQDKTAAARLLLISFVRATFRFAHNDF